MDSPGAVRIATNACRVRCFQPLSHFSMAERAHGQLDMTLERARAI
jgi:hypothetical protein